MPKDPLLGSGAGALKFINNVIKRALREELELQGHNLTGELIESVDVITERNGLDYLFNVIIADYGKFIDEGIPAESISWRMYPRVIFYYEQLGYNEQEAKKYAAATIKKWMVTGMPSPGSIHYSRNSKRTGFIKDAFDKWDGDIGEELARAFTYGVNIYFDEHFKSEII